MIVESEAQLQVLNERQGNQKILSTLISQQTATIKFLKDQEAILIEELESFKLQDMAKIDKIEMVLVKNDNATGGKEQYEDESPIQREYQAWHYKDDAQANEEPQYPSLENMQ